MKKAFVGIIFGAVIVAGTLMVLGCSEEKSQPPQSFTTQLFQHIAKDKAGENFVLSGDSLASVLMMLQYGATGNTQRELSLALCGKSQLCSAEGFADTVGYLAANAVWVQQGLAVKSDYRTEIEKHFKSKIESVDFQKKKTQAVDKINTWAKKNTKGMIKEIVKDSDIDPMTVMVLANALYFQGFWPTEFDAKKTTDRDFTLVDGKTISVPTMIKKDNYFQAKKNDIQLVGLPYRDSQLEMLILMPEDPKKFQDFVRNLSTETIASLVAEQSTSELMLTLPKFSVSSSYDDLKSTLKAMGINQVFGADAELKKINDTVPLFLSKVLQKAVIQVDEKGTKAAAVSAGIVLTRAVLLNNVQINRPFVFAIYDQKTHKIPFIGQVVNPLK